MTIWGVRDLREIQIKFCTTQPPTATWDAAQTPIARIVGTCGMKKVVNRVFPTEATGLMSDHIMGRYYDPWVMAELPIAMGDEGLTYQQFPWYLAMGAVGVLNSAAGVWTFTPMLTAADYPYVASIIYGDNAGAWIANACFARQLMISAAFKGPWNLEADIVGRDMDEDSLEDIAYPTPLNTILGQLTVLNTHPNCQFGSATKIPGKLIDWRLTIPGFHPKFFQDGIHWYSIMGLASRHLTFEATVEWDSAWSKAEHAIWAASHFAATPSVPRYMELVATGGPTGGAPATYSTEIKMVLMYESFETLEERDGNDIVKFVARSVYDVGPCDGGFNEWSIEVNNAIAALP